MPIENHNIRELNTEELTNILRNYHGFSSEEVHAVYQELDARGELKAVLNELREEMSSAKTQSESGHPEKEPVDFNPSNKITLRIGTTQQMVFEQRLLQEGIPYYHTEGNDFFVPEVNYYFTDKDFVRADLIEMETQSYVDEMPRDQMITHKSKMGNSLIWIIAIVAIFLLASWLFSK
nr:hypothetical protein [Bacteroidota bacterium]